MKQIYIRDIPFGILFLVIAAYIIDFSLYLCNYPNLFVWFLIVICVHSAEHFMILSVEFIRGFYVRYVE